MTDERDELWRELGVDNQTAAIVRIRGLIERDERRSYMPTPTQKPDKKGTVIIGAIVALVIGIAAIAWHQGMLN